MKVIHVNVSDNKGGAARAAFRLHQGLSQEGLNSSMVVTEKHSENKHIYVPVQDKIGFYERRLHYRQLSARFWRYAPSRPPGLGPFTHPSTYQNRHLVSKLPDADIINLHWIAHFVDLPTFLPQCQAPLVWTLHDMNTFTGGCHYALDCDKYQKQCGACPQLGSQSNQDISHKIWLAKQKVYRLVSDGKLHIVTPSKWLAEEAQSSSLLQHMPISVIPNGLNTTIFKPYDKTEARSQLKIPLSAKVILFSAASIISLRKGLKLLLDALQMLDKQSNIVLVSLGTGKIKQNLSIPTLSLGYLKNEQQIALAYSAADLFVIPSLQDNLPNTVMESLACGTPVVGFDVGGIADMVRPGISGQLVPAKNVRQLQQAITSLLDNKPLRAEMAANCRQIALSEYSLHVQAKQYINLYQNLLNHKPLSC